MAAFLGHEPELELKKHGWPWHETKHGLKKLDLIWGLLRQGWACPPYFFKFLDKNIGNPYQMEDNKAAPSAPPSRVLLSSIW